MLTFAGLVVAHWFGFTAPNIPESVQNSLLNIVLVGMGGYIVGRSGEKIMDKYKEKKIMPKLDGKSYGYGKSGMSGYKKHSEQKD